MRQLREYLEEYDKSHGHTYYTDMSDEEMFKPGGSGDPANKKKIAESNISTQEYTE